KVRKELPVSTELIYLVPDGQLSLLPFEALVDENNKYLIEHYRFAYLSSGRDLLRASTAGTGKGTVVFADPNYELRAAEREKTAKLLLAALDKPSAAEMSFIAADLNQSGAPYSGALSIDVRSGALRWDKLKGSAAEARDVSEQLAAIAYGPVKPYLRDEALEEVFKRVRSPRVLHVSTHGFFLEGETEAPQERQAPLELENAAVVGRELLRRASGENPLLRSGLVLAGANELKDLAEASTPEKGAGEQSKVDDGWLTAEEVALMDLRGTELVVLSACETGQGDVRNGEGVYGLRRAFQLAGAQTIVMTLFKVPD